MLTIVNLCLHKESGEWAQEALALDAWAFSGDHLGDPRRNGAGLWRTYATISSVEIRIR